MIGTKTYQYSAPFNTIVDKAVSVVATGYIMGSSSGSPLFILGLHILANG